ncbi:MAG: antibiotic biosynthesis monooxygenase [Pseudomonadales bacterium]|nr:antibiotic biosynthesis monooxygenase [Pseudomonadales bacterium]
MIYNNVMLTVKNFDDIETVRELLKEQARMSTEEPGCERFEVYHSRSDRQQFLLVERWETEEDLALHKEAKAFTELYLPKVIPLVERTPHLSDQVWP